MKARIWGAVIRRDADSVASKLHKRLRSRTDLLPRRAGHYKLLERFDESSRIISVNVLTIVINYRSRKTSLVLHKCSRSASTWLTTWNDRIILFNLNDICYICKEV
jgi:hypothetical protein